MKTHPILFSAPMICALLDGRKTQTRRAMNPQPFYHGNDIWQYKGSLWNIDKIPLPPAFNSPLDYCKYQVGDLLWVRETFCKVDDTKYTDDGKIWYDYRATPSYEESHPAGWENAPDDAEALKWKPSIHMPRAASRLTLEVTSVRVERLQDISEKDAMAEGCNKIEHTWWQGFMRYSDGSRHMIECGDGREPPPDDLENAEIQTYIKTSKEQYQTLWQSINGTGSWDANPWVWVLEFVVHQQNIDEFLKARK